MDRTAALFVEEGGCYYGLEAWNRGACPEMLASMTGRPVVAHPVQAVDRRILWFGSVSLPKAKNAFEFGDDNGCFKRTNSAVRKWRSD